MTLNGVKWWIKPWLLTLQLARRVLIRVIVQPLLCPRLVGVWDRRPEYPFSITLSCAFPVTSIFFLSPSFHLLGCRPLLSVAVLNSSVFLLSLSTRLSWHLPHPSSRHRINYLLHSPHHRFLLHTSSFPIILFSVTPNILINIRISATPHSLIISLLPCPKLRPIHRTHLSPNSSPHLCLLTAFYQPAPLHSNVSALFELIFSPNLSRIVCQLIIICCNWSSLSAKMAKSTANSRFPQIFCPEMFRKNIERETKTCGLNDALGGVPLRCKTHWAALRLILPMISSLCTFPPPTSLSFFSGISTSLLSGHDHMFSQDQWSIEFCLISFNRLPYQLSYCEDCIYVALSGHKFEFLWIRLNHGTNFLLYHPI